MFARRLFERATGVKVIVSLPGNGKRTNRRLNKKTNEGTDLALQGSYSMRLERVVKERNKNCIVALKNWVTIIEFPSSTQT